MGRRESKNFVILPGCITYKGWTRPRSVTPRSSSEWTPMSIAGWAVLVHQVCPNVILLRSSSCLPQSYVADLMVGPGSFKPSFVRPAFHVSHLELLLEAVN